MASKDCKLRLWTLTFFLAALAAVGVSSAAERPVAKKAVTVTLKITDKPSGLTVTATKTVPSGANAFDVMRDMVALKYTTYPKLGPMVTSLCGVDAPAGVFWALYVDGALSQVGIASITIDKDTLIEWKTKKIEP